MKDSLSEINNPIIGIVGGAGPHSCIDVQFKVLQAMKNRRCIIGDADYDRIIVDNNTWLSNRDQQFFSNDGGLLVQQILASLEAFTIQGVSIAAIACNSAHIFFDQIQGATSLELLHIVHVVGDYLHRNQIKQVGLLSTLSVYQSGIYQSILEDYGVAIITPSRENKIRLAQVIYGIKAGLSYSEMINDFNNEETQRHLQKVYQRYLLPLLSHEEYQALEFQPCKYLFEKVVRELQMQGTDEIILGCTELPLLAELYKYLPAYFIDPNYLLAESLVEHIQKVSEVC